MSQSPAAGSVSIAIVGSNGPQAFNPNPASLRMGQAVAWRNNDGVVHHILQDSENDASGGYGPVTANGGFDAGETSPGATSSSLTLTQAGTLRYHCSIHPTMVGTLTVTQ